MVYLFFEFFGYSFRNFLARVKYERNLGLKSFSRFLGLSHPVSAKTKAGKRFIYFFNFLAIFFRIFLPESCMNGIRGKNFFLFFSGNLIPFWLKILPEWGFLIFWKFCYFFLNFLARVDYERNSGLKFFSRFLGLSYPVLAENNTEKKFFNFLSFFAIFFGIFFPWSKMNGIRD